MFENESDPLWFQWSVLSMLMFNWILNIFLLTWCSLILRRDWNKAYIVKRRRLLILSTICLISLANLVSATIWITAKFSVWMYENAKFYPRFFAEFPLLVVSLSAIVFRIWFLYYDMEFHRYLTNLNWKTAINNITVKQHWTFAKRSTLGNFRFLFVVSIIIAIILCGLLYLFDRTVPYHFTNSYMTLFASYCIVLTLISTYILYRMYKMKLHYKYDNLGIKKETFRLIAASAIFGGLTIMCAILRRWFSLNSLATEYDIVDLLLWFLHTIQFNSYIFITVPWASYDMKHFDKDNKNVNKHEKEQSKKNGKRQSLERSATLTTLFSILSTTSPKLKLEAGDSINSGKSTQSSSNHSNHTPPTIPETLTMAKTISGSNPNFKYKSRKLSGVFDHDTDISTSNINAINANSNTTTASTSAITIASAHTRSNGSISIAPPKKLELSPVGSQSPAPASSASPGPGVPLSRKSLGSVVDSVNSHGHARLSSRLSLSSLGIGGASLRLSSTNSLGIDNGGHNSDSNSTNRVHNNNNNQMKSKRLRWIDAVTTPMGYEAFMIYLETEFSTENLMVVTEVEWSRARCAEHGTLQYAQIKQVLRDHFEESIDKAFLNKKQFNLDLPKDGEYVPQSLIATSLNDCITNICKSKKHGIIDYKDEKMVKDIGYSIINAFVVLYTKYIENGNAMFEINISHITRNKLANMLDKKNFCSKPPLLKRMRQGGNDSPSISIHLSRLFGSSNNDSTNLVAMADSDPDWDQDDDLDSSGNRDRDYDEKKTQPNLDSVQDFRKDEPLKKTDNKERQSKKSKKNEKNAKNEKNVVVKSNVLITELFEEKWDVKSDGNKSSLNGNAEMGMGSNVEKPKPIEWLLYQLISNMEDAVFEIAGLINAAFLRFQKNVGSDEMDAIRRYSQKYKD